MKILLTAANGQLGTDLRSALHNHTVIATSRSGNGFIALDVGQPGQAQTLLEAHKPDLVLNTSAFHRVDDIEKDASQALNINALAAQQLALLCRAAGIPLLHISTDYVFDGAKRAPYVESDLPNPLSAYGASKVAGESLIRAAWHKHYIVRTCGLYGWAGASGKGGNFVNTMLRLAREGKPIKVVRDQICTPTFTKELAEHIAALIETGSFGTYHITNDGGCAWSEFAAEIFKLAGLNPALTGITSEEYNAPAKRPPYSVLENAGLKRLGIDHMRPWREALAEYIGGL